MALNPEELVTLTNHGNMKLRSAVIKSDDIATEGAQANDNCPRRRSSDLELRGDQGTRGTVARTACANRLTLAPGVLKRGARR